MVIERDRSALTADDVRAVIRDEVALLLDERAAAAIVEPAAEMPPEQLQTHVARASTLLDDAVGRGQMDHDTQAQFHRLLAGMPRTEQEPLLARMIAAINAQELDIAPAH